MPPRAAANLYAIDIPSVDPVQSDTAQVVLAEPSPRIRHNTPKKLRSVGADLVTEEELFETELRHRAILNQQANIKYPGAGAPAWFHQAIAPLIQAVRISGQNGASRLFNSQVHPDTGQLEPLLNEEGNVPAGFPGTVAALRALPVEQVDRLLQAYGLPIDGEEGAKRRRLGIHLGPSK